MGLFLNHRQIIASLLLCSMTSVSFAHEMVVSGDVAAMIHLDPQDHPKAGVPSQIWFALTKKAGEPIPLSHCQCHLVIYPVPRQNIAPLTPTLKGLNNEKYKDIPSAVVTFSKPGLYRLELVGEPIKGENFSHFKISREVMVTK
jgi:hypothetical protein